jgi:hypothetical protein
MGRGSSVGGGGAVPPPPPPQRTVYCGVANTLGRSFPSQAVYIIASVVPRQQSLVTFWCWLQRRHAMRRAA